MKCTYAFQAGATTHVAPEVPGVKDPKRMSKQRQRWGQVEAPLLMGEGTAHSLQLVCSER